MLAHIGQPRQNVGQPGSEAKITNWTDTNGPFCDMYWGRKSLRHKGHPNFRPTPTFKRATSKASEIPERKR